MFEHEAVELLVADGDGVRKGEVVARLVATGTLIRSTYDGTVEIAVNESNMFFDVACKDGHTYGVFYTVIR